MPKKSPAVQVAGAAGTADLPDAGENGDQVVNMHGRPLEPLALTLEGVMDAVPSLSRSQLFVELKSGRLPSFMTGRRRCVRVVDLETWLAQRAGEAAS